MKKLKVLGLAAMAASMFSLISCLDSGSNTSSGTVFGYAQYNTTAGRTIVSDDYGSAYASTSFDSQLSGGAYVSFYAEINYDEQTSSSYLAVTASSITKYPEYTLSSAMQDTTSLMTNETTIDAISLVTAGSSSDIYYAFTANKHAFVGVTHADVPSDMDTDYEFFYNASIDPITVDGNRVYELYVRAIKTDEGDNTTTDLTVIGAYDLTYFLNRTLALEKNAGNSNIYFRFRYINSIDSETNTGTFGGVSNIFALPISTYQS